jgi:hypothetical protein
MSNVEQLITKPVRTAADNREMLIDRARHDCAAFGMDLDFDRYDWNVTAYCPRPAGKAGQKAVLYFTTHENGTSKGIEGRTPLPEPFCSVLKALVRLKKDGNPKLVDLPLSRMIIAARYLIPLLEDRGYDPCRLIPRDFDEACHQIRARGGSPSTHYRIGQSLAEISRELNRYNITLFPFTWKNTFRRVTNEARIGVKAEEAGRKLPEQQVLNELARISHLVTDDSDRVLMAAVKLMHCAPWRVGEVNTLSANCWVEVPYIKDGHPVLDEEGNPRVRSGIRYWPEKATDTDIKWIPDVMVPVAKHAIDTLLEISRPARELARWYEQNIGRAWLPGPDHGPNQHFPLKELVDTLGFSNVAAVRTMLRSKGVAIYGERGDNFVVREDIEKILLSKWRKLDYLGKDRRGMRRSEHLFLVNEHLHSYRGTNPCALEMTTDQHISDFLCGRGSAEGRVRSVFERFDSVDSKGNPLRINTHDFRHWLNTLVQQHGADQAIVAKWSGRTDIKQNAEYDHVPGIRLAEVGRDLMAKGKVFGALADVHKALDPADRETFREAMFATAHITELGICDHDYHSAPCPELSFDGCSVCEHLNVEKGNQPARERAERTRVDVQWLLDRAKADLEDGCEDASNFVDAHTMMLEGLDRILAIHDDPTIPEGSWVRANKESPKQFGGKPLKGV